ncbi:MAG: 3-carboxy-cis,cis-muconate cycloisomerase [Catenulispora sp.]|nr:3-carboxy-cis,cis-muconate cycloisomerase [Catenulispora sp.]
MIEAEVALARAQGVRVPPPVLDAAALAARTREGGNPVTPLLAALDDRRLHRGATSQDILDTALMLTARRALTLAALDLDTAIAAAGRLAAEYRDTPMAARTLTQQAVPTTFGLKAAGWHHLLTSARRTIGATARSLPAQLGGAAGTLASFVALAEADVPYAPHGAGSEPASGAGADSDSGGGADAVPDAVASSDPGSGPASGSGSDSGTGSDAVPDSVSSSAQHHSASAHLLTDAGHEQLPPGAEPYAGVELLTDSAASSSPDPGAVTAGDATVQSPADTALALVARFARTLGLSEPLLPWHVLRTPIADLASALASASGALGKVAADVLVLARTEIGEVSEGVGGVSSTMPHKANPVRAVLIAGAARQVPALASVLFASVAAEDERPAGAWHAEWQPLREALRLVGGSAATAAELLTGLRVHPDRMAENLARLDLAEARNFTGRDVTDPRDYLGAAPLLVDRALKETP